jgi:hypothetical protein
LILNFLYKIPSQKAIRHTTREARKRDRKSLPRKANDNSAATLKATGLHACANVGILHKRRNNVQKKSEKKYHQR